MNQANEAPLIKIFPPSFILYLFIDNRNNNLRNWYNRSRCLSWIFPFFGWAIFLSASILDRYRCDHLYCCILWMLWCCQGELLHGVNGKILDEGAMIKFVIWFSSSQFSCLMILVFILELAAGISGYVLRNQTMDLVETGLNNSMRYYGTAEENPKSNMEITVLWDQVQTGVSFIGIFLPFQIQFYNKPLFSVWLLRSS